MVTDTLTGKMSCTPILFVISSPSKRPNGAHSQKRWSLYNRHGVHDLCQSNLYCVNGDGLFDRDEWVLIPICLSNGPFPVVTQY